MERDAEGQWLERFPPEVIRLVEELRGDPEAPALVPADEFYQTSARMILLRAYEERMARLQRELAQAAPEQQMQLLQELLEVQRKMREQELSGVRKTGSLRPAPAGEER